MLNSSIQLLMCEYFIPISSVSTINRLNFVVTRYDTFENFANLCFKVFLLLIHEIHFYLRTELVTYYEI
jgi:hypothetical protein